MKIAVLVGSLRTESFSRKTANALISMAPSSLTLEIVELGDLPMYNEDLDKGEIPKAWIKFRKVMSEKEGFIFVTPEYNRSIPAVIKNAIDVGSRPYGKSVWSGKPGAVASISQGALGGFGANHHLRQSMVFLNVPLMQQPEIYLGKVADCFDEKGKVSKENTKELLQKFIDSFATWCKHFSKQS